MTGRKRLKRTLAPGLVRFLDAPARGRQTAGHRGMCRICIQPELYDAVYEFARARELLRTTDITYRSFFAEYVSPVFGRRVSYKHMSNCLSDHVRPALKKEAFIYELEQSRREGRAPLTRDIDDFCLGRPLRSDFTVDSGSSWFAPGVSDLDDPDRPCDKLTEEDLELYRIRGIEECLQDPEEEDGVTHYRLVYWANTLTQDRCGLENCNDEH